MIVANQHSIINTLSTLLKRLQITVRLCHIIYLLSGYKHNMKDIKNMQFIANQGFRTITYINAILSMKFPRTDLVERKGTQLSGKVIIY